MAPIIRPTRKVSFSSHAKGPLPVDMLDAQIQNLIDAIHSTQEALADVRRDDGQLKSPAPQGLSPEAREVERKIADTGAAVAVAASQFQAIYREMDLRVRDAETAAFSVSRAIDAAPDPRDALSEAEAAAEEAKNAAIASQNSANYSQAQTDNAIAANVEATQWAEYLAGPVVNSAEAPAYIAGHPFGHGLYYQPVEGYGGMGGLWSAKWWAIYAAQLVGTWNFYYLGSWATPPVPGSTNPATGIKVPTPLSPGSFYYNTTSNQLFIWDGTQWKQPFVQVLTPGIQSSFVYVASAGQTVFSGIDVNGHVPAVGLSPSDVHKNGLRLVYGVQYTVNQVTSTLTLVTPATVGDVVQWDLLSGEDISAGVGINVRKVTIRPVPDGIKTEFTMTYIDSGAIEQAVDVTGGPQLQVSQDGIFQEPGVDFVASGNVLTMGVAPPVNSRFWGLWFAAGAVEAPPVNTPPANIALPAITGATAQGSLLSATVGGWAGYPVPTYAFQWKSAGANVGTNASTYITVAGDLGKIITVAVTATNSQGSATATSGNFGPVTAATPADTTPDPFTFVDHPAAAVSTYYESNTITVTGIEAAANVSIANGEYSKNGSVFTSAVTTAALNDTFKVRGISSPGYLTPVNVVLTIGGVSDTFTITTEAAPPADTVPDPFTFVDAVGAATSTVVTSNTITVSGINTGSPISVTGGEYNINGTGWTSSAGTVFNTNSVMLRGTSSSVTSTTTLVVLNIGGVTDTFSITTAALSLAAPSIELSGVSDSGLSKSDNITNDNTPMFTVICATAPAAGDVIKIFRDGALVTSVTLVQSDIDGTTAPSLGTSALADGSYVFTAQHLKGAAASTLSAALSVTIDTAAPVLTVPTGVQNSVVQNNADLGITTNTASGILYWVVQPAAMAAPTSYQIISGAGSDDFYVSPGMSGNFAVTTAGAKTATATGIGASGSYKVYWTQRDVAGNDTVTVASAPWTQTLTVFTANGIGGFDGSLTYATCALGGTIPQGKKGLVSFWLRNLGGSGNRYVFSIASGGVIKLWCFVNSSNAIQITARQADPGSTDSLAIQSNLVGSPLVPPSPWVHCAFAWDLGAGPAVGQVYLNGASFISGSSTLLANDLGYNMSTMSLGASVAGALKLNGSLSELYVNLHETLDLSNPANIQKFRTNTGDPVSLGATGLLPTGTQPEFYLGYDKNYLNWGTNNGSKGNFVLQGGSFTNVTGPP